MASGVMNFVHHISACGFRCEEFHVSTTPRISSFSQPWIYAQVMLDDMFKL
jgi:hypothetical protein